MRILVIDVGGTSVKVLVTGHKKPVRILSSPIMTAVKMVEAVRAATVTWEYNAASIGYPGSVVQGHPIIEPYHLGRGWVGLDSKKVFTRPVKFVNDMAMQALGSYQGDRMLFLGFGTGLGSPFCLRMCWSPWNSRTCPTRRVGAMKTLWEPLH